MKLSELKTENVIDYLKIEYEDSNSQEFDLLESMLQSAKSYILSFTGLSAEEADECPDLVMAAYVICQDYYDNRSFYLEGNRSLVSKLIDNTLGLHRVNLL